MPGPDGACGVQRWLAAGSLVVRHARCSCLPAHWPLNEPFVSEKNRWIVEHHGLFQRGDQPRSGPLTGRAPGDQLGDQWIVVYPHELTEMIEPAPVPAGCSHGPPEDPPESSQLGSHQLAASMFSMSSAQYMKYGSSE